MRKLLFLQFAVFAVVVAALGIAAFCLLLWDFQFPGTFRSQSLVRGGMSLNLLLLLSFGLQHSLMARKVFKRAFARLIPPELERSFYVLASGFMLFTLALLWSPMSPPLYDLRGSWPGYLLQGGALVGLVVMALALTAQDAWDLVGVRSVLHILRGHLPQPQPFRTPSLYRYVRHPLYLGMLLLFWLSPVMTHDHLFFAEVMTAYVLVGIQFEERDLLATHGDAYRHYQARVPMLIPFPRRRKR